MFSLNISFIICKNRNKEYWSGETFPFLLQGIFLSQEQNLGLLHYRQILYYLSRQGAPLNS